MMHAPRLVALATVASVASAAAVMSCREGDTLSSNARDVPPRFAQVATPASLLVKGETLFLASEFDSAEATWNQALREARTSSDTLAQARILTWLGHSARMRGDVVAARSLLESALNLKLEALDSAEAGESYNALGLLANDEDRFVEARSAFERALAAGGDRRLMAKANGNLGLALAYLGELGPSRRHIATMLDSSVALREPRFEANALSNLAMLDIWEGRADAALPALARAREIYRRIDYAPGEQNALGQLAVALEGMGDYGAAFAALDSSLDIARDKGMRGYEAEILRLIAGLHSRLGSLPAALRQYDAAAVAADSVGAAGEVGSIRRSTADIHLRLGNVEAAGRDALAALQAHRTVGAKVDEVDDLVLLARVERTRRDSAAADRRLREGARIAEEIGAPSLVRTVALETARVADARGHARSVLRALKPFARERAEVDAAMSVDAHALMARAWEGLGRLDSAVAVRGRAIDALARLRQRLGSEPLRRALMADRSRIYADHVLTLLRLGRVTEAFSVSDAARSRGLLEHLASVRPAESGDAVERERLLREIDAVSRLLEETERMPASERNEGAVSTSASLARRLERARAQYEAQLARSARSPSTSEAILASGSLAPATVQAVLGPDERLLEYLVARDRIVLFVVSREGVRPLEIQADLSAITEQVRIVRETWGHAGDQWRVALPASRALHRALIGPAREAGLLRDVARVVVVPHGILSQVPFAALLDERSGRWLVEELDVLYLPSAAALPALRSRRGSTGSGTGRVAFAPFPDQLPATRGEAKAVRAAASGGRTYLAAEATEAALREALAGPDVVHVATHAVMSARNPMFSRVAMARPRGRTRVDDDGRLEVHELLDISVRSPLVFLAGCETSAFQSWLDDPVRGSDHTTLAQAFLLAGAGNVAGTLWRIGDAAAAVFATEFHRHLQTRPPTAALGAAQRRLLRDARHQNPYFWASYLMTGSGIL